MDQASAFPLLSSLPSLYLVNQAAVAQRTAQRQWVPLTRDPHFLSASSTLSIHSREHPLQNLQQHLPSSSLDNCVVCAAVHANQYLRICAVAAAPSSAAHPIAAADHSQRAALVASIDGRAVGWIPLAFLTRVTSAPAVTVASNALHCFLGAAVIGQQHRASLIHPRMLSLSSNNAASAAAAAAAALSSVSSSALVMSPLKRRSSMRAGATPSSTPTKNAAASSSSSSFSSAVAATPSDVSASSSSLSALRAGNVEVLASLFGGRPTPIASTAAAAASIDPGVDAAQNDSIFRFVLRRRAAPTAASEASADGVRGLVANEVVAISPAHAAALSLAPFPEAPESATVGSINNNSNGNHRALPLSSNLDVRHVVVFSGSAASALGSGASGFVLLGALRPPEDFVAPASGGVNSSTSGLGANDSSSSNTSSSSPPASHVRAARAALVALRGRVRAYEESLQKRAAALGVPFSHNTTSSNLQHQQQRHQESALLDEYAASPTRARSSRHLAAASATSSSSAAPSSFLERTGNSPLLGANIVAVKLVALPPLHSSKFELLRREIVIHAAASRHPNVVPLFGVFPVYGGAGGSASLNLNTIATVVPPLPAPTPEFGGDLNSNSNGNGNGDDQNLGRVIAVALVFSWCDGGSLDTLMQAAIPQLSSGGDGALVAPLREFELAAVCEGLLSGLNFLHTELGVAHRDIKHFNVLLTSYGQVLISDLGIAKQVAAADADATTTSTAASASSPLDIVGAGNAGATLCGSPLFLAPELFQHMFPSSQRPSAPVGPMDLRRADVFSLGVLLRILLFENATEALPEETIRSAALDEESDALISPTVCRETRDLIASMLCPDPAQRPSCAEMLASAPLLRKFDLSLPASQEIGTNSHKQQQCKLYPCIASLVGAAALPAALADEVILLAECVNISPERLRRQHQEQQQHQRGDTSPQSSAVSTTAAPVAGMMAGAAAAAAATALPLGNSPQHMSYSEVLHDMQQQQQQHNPLGGVSANGDDDDDGHASPLPRHPPHVHPLPARSVSFAPAASSGTAMMMMMADAMAPPMALHLLRNNSQQDSTMLRELIAETLRGSSAGASPRGVAVAAVDIANRHGTAVVPSSLSSTSHLAAGTGSSSIGCAPARAAHSVHRG